MIWWKLSSCPRCKGAMFIEKELYYGWYKQCIMCGYTYQLRDTIKFEYQRVRTKWERRDRSHSK
jgi:DNA-directed RNA polymerase subunit M/transcription elongation factor TFIIS